MKCPGQDMQFWKPGDIYEVDCPGCGRTVEFFKDDTARRCGADASEHGLYGPIDTVRDHVQPGLADRGAPGRRNAAGQ